MPLKKNKSVDISGCQELGVRGGVDRKGTGGNLGDEDSVS